MAESTSDGSGKRTRKIRRLLIIVMVVAFVTYMVTWTQRWFYWYMEVVTEYETLWTVASGIVPRLAIVVALLLVLLSFLRTRTRAAPVVAVASLTSMAVSAFFGFVTFMLYFGNTGSERSATYEPLTAAKVGTVAAFVFVAASIAYSFMSLRRPSLPTTGRTAERP